MEQQLILATIEITPSTMDSILDKIQSILSSPQLSPALLANVVKSLFYGLWNFDKMINQHHLSTRIAQMIGKLPKKNAYILLKEILLYLTEKWNLIDHHRINKFMQLVRYLIKQAMKLEEKSTRKLNKLLLSTVYSNLDSRSGLAYHIADIFFSILKETHGVTLDGLSLFEQLLKEYNVEHFRLYILEHVYEAYKKWIIQNANSEKLDALDQQIQSFCNRFLTLAKEEEKDLHRKNLYTLVGYMKSDELSFPNYLHQKEEKAKEQKLKKQKKITKGKKLTVIEKKKKRKEKNKRKQKSKILSVGKFEYKSKAAL